MSVFVPNFDSAPVPDMAFEIVTPSERLTAKVALLTTAADPKLPVVLPAPIWRVPALIVVAPL